MTERTARSAAGARALLRAAAALVAGAVVTSVYVAATLNAALDRYVEQHRHINVEDWRFGPWLDVVVNLIMVMAGALCVAVPALRLARRGWRPGVTPLAFLGAGVALLGLPLMLWLRFDPVLAYEVAVRSAKAGAYGWWYYPTLACATALTAACVFGAVVLRLDRRPEITTGHLRIGM